MNTKALIPMIFCFLPAWDKTSLRVLNNFIDMSLAHTHVVDICDGVLFQRPTPSANCRLSELLKVCRSLLQSLEFCFCSEWGWTGSMMMPRFWGSHAGFEGMVVKCGRPLELVSHCSWPVTGTGRSLEHFSGAVFQTWLVFCSFCVLRAFVTWVASFTLLSVTRRSCTMLPAVLNSFLYCSCLIRFRQKVLVWVSTKDKCPSNIHELLELGFTEMLGFTCDVKALPCHLCGGFGIWKLQRFRAQDQTTQDSHETSTDQPNWPEKECCSPTKIVGLLRLKVQETHQSQKSPGILVSPWSFIHVSSFWNPWFVAQKRTHFQDARCRCAHVWQVNVGKRTTNGETNLHLFAWVKLKGQSSWDAVDSLQISWGALQATAVQLLVQWSCMFFSRLCHVYHNPHNYVRDIELTEKHLLEWQISA